MGKSETTRDTEKILMGGLPYLLCLYIIEYGRQLFYTYYDVFLIEHTFLRLFCTTNRFLHKPESFDAALRQFETKLLFICVPRFFR